MEDMVRFNKFFTENTNVHFRAAVRELIDIIFIDENADTPTKRVQSYHAHKAIKEIEKLFYASRNYVEENKLC